MIQDFRQGLRNIMLTLLVTAAVIAVIAWVSHRMHRSVQGVTASPPMHLSQH